MLLCHGRHKISCVQKFKSNHVEITEKAGNETRQVRTHTWAPSTTPTLKSLHLRLHMCKVIHSSLESSDAFHRAPSLVNPISDVLLPRSVLVMVPSRGKGSGSGARFGVIMRGVVTTNLMVTPIPSVPLGLLRVSLRCSRGLLCCLIPVVGGSRTHARSQFYRI
jgi:hypothetical protein